MSGFSASEDREPNDPRFALISKLVCVTDFERVTTITTSDRGAYNNNFNEILLQFKYLNKFYLKNTK